MRFKFLLVLIFVTGIARAQCDYPSAVNTSLIITEARFMSDNWAYLELTNMGNSPIFLSNFKIGKLANLSWSAGVLDLCNDVWYMPSRPGYIFLPQVVLMPGQSWVMTTAFDFGPEYYKKYKGRLGGSERPKQPEMYEVADKLIHRQESIDGVTYPGDSISNPIDDPEQTVKRGNYTDLYSAVGGGTYFIEHHFSSTDSAVVDQVGGFFDSDNGRNIRGKEYDVAGVLNAMGTSVLVRKNTVKGGNLDFANAVGVSIDDSEWIPIQMPAGYDQWRDIWWTIGNHGNYVLDENTLEPTLDGLSVDFANKQITVPWGIRRLDEIMRNMVRTPGIAWNYILNDVQEDSVYRSAKTGDQLTVYALGNTLTTATFDIVVSEPTADDNIVIPIDHVSDGSSITPRTQNGILDWPRVTKHDSGMDTITGEGFGLEFAMRVDTLLAYLEKPAKATWEIVWVDGIKRADLKNGDILKVTSENGKEKEYFIQIQTFLPSDNSVLSAITWPEIPEYYKNFLGWKGDTIPTFSPGVINYKLEVPFDVDGIPALVPTPQDMNATVKTTRAISVTGSKEDRTVKFEVTAEDDSTMTVYTIEFIKEKAPANVEPFYADPIYSEFGNSYTRNVFLEIYNPGTLPIDLRDYAFSMDKYTDNGYDVIRGNHSWERRFSVYIPGLKYVDSLTYQVTPELLESDVNVNPLLQPGECFVMANIGRDTQNDGYWPNYDVNFANEKIPGHPNPWNETVSNASSSGLPMLPNGIRENSMFMYKVLNDSVKNGLKPVDDPDDFEIIDMMGMAAPDFQWIVGDFVAGDNQAQDIYKRKPWVHKGNPVPGAAFAPFDEEACEWIRISPGAEYGDLPNTVEVAFGGLGTHYMEPITFYRSTLNSKIYKISVGFGRDQEILGLTTGTKVSEFLTGIYKEDEDQTLVFMSGADTTNLLEESSVISPDDMLKVISADSSNTTYYRLDVTEDGLSSDAILTSDVWDIEIGVSPDVDQGIIGEATITGFNFQTTLKSLLNNLDVPEGAAYTFINSKGDYVALKTLNYDTVYVDTKVNANLAIDVVAEDAKTRIIYDLKPESAQNEAFILSDVYLISQDKYLIEYIPGGITFSEFQNNIIIPKGATLKLIDKFGFERTIGDMKADDKVVVTSSDGSVTNTYYVSLIIQGSTSSTFLAYVVSDQYTINQVDFTIYGGSAVSEGTNVPEFLSNIEPSTGATFELFDENGNNKTSGNLAEGDYLVVTSGDGSVIVNYNVLLNFTSVNRSLLTNFEIYPNPTDGVLNISGLSAGNRIHIYNMQGKLMREFETQTNHQAINLEYMPDGLFVIIISDENQIVGQFRAMKK